MADSWEKAKNKKKVINMIKDFIRTPSIEPLFKYEFILGYIEGLKENMELSYAHYDFVKQVLKVEYGIIALQYKQWEGEKDGDKGILK